MPGATTSSIHNRYKLLVLALLALFLGTSLYSSATRLLWKDEAFSAYEVHGSYADTLSRASRDTHPPLYPLILKTWSVAFGTSALALRSLSIVFGFVVCVSLWAILKKLHSPKPALFAVVSVLLPANLRFINDVRMYPLAAAETALATLVFLVCIERHKLPLYLLGLYCLLLLAGFYTYYLTIIVFFGHLGFYYYYKREHAGIISSSRKFLSTFWPVIIGLIVGIVPYLPTFLYKLASVQSGFWIPPLNGSLPLRALIYVVTSVSDSFNTPAGRAVSVAVVVGGVVLSIRLIRTVNRQAKDSEAVRKHIVLLLPVLCLVVFLLAVSLPPRQSVFEPRYLAPMLPLFFAGCLSLAYMLIHRRAKRAAGILLWTVIGVGVVFSVTSQVYRVKDNGSAGIIISAITPRLKPGDALIAGSIYQAAETYYYESNHTPMYVIAPRSLPNAQEGIFVYDHPSTRLDSIDSGPFTRAWLIVEKGTPPPAAASHFTSCGVIDQKYYRAYCLQRDS